MVEPVGMTARRLPVVMIVDDTKTNLMILAEALKQDYAILTATDGAEALSLLKQGELPDLILLDVVMPGMDGYEVCRRIKQDPATRHIPVIFVTSMADSRDQKLGFDLGAVDYITKPFEVLLVVARVNVHMRLKLKSEQLEKLAFLDSLTDIPNRRALEENLEREWGRAKRSGTPLSVLMIDIDSFKPFNDHYGHGVGDDCLRRIARELQRGLMRPGDFIGRYGGEEFSVILPNCDLAGAALVAEKLRERVESLGIPHACSDVADHVTISVGYTTRIVVGDAILTALTEEADKALYLAKSRGRNQISAATGNF